MSLAGSGSAAGAGGEEFAGGFLPERWLGVWVVGLAEIRACGKAGAAAGVAAPLDLALGQQRNRYQRYNGAHRCYQHSSSRYSYY